MGTAIRGNYKEETTQPKSSSGLGTKKVVGPAVGHTKSNPTKSGGIHRPTKGKM
jgi:hypothetical protein